VPETLRCCKTIICTHFFEQCRNTCNNTCPHCRDPEPVTQAIRQKGIYEIMRIIRILKAALEETLSDLPRLCE